jgi:enoyl-CoA hydratase/carnithine racemase
VSAQRQRLEAGTQFRLPPRPMTRERMRWYVDIQDTVYYNDGRIHAQPTIHDDDAYAKKQGLPGIIADGMISTNWILSLLIDVFGADAAKRRPDACGSGTSVRRCSRGSGARHARVRSPARQRRRRHALRARRVVRGRHRQESDGRRGARACEGALTGANRDFRRTSMPLQHVKLDVADYVATVTLDRPPVNAFNRVIRQEIVDTFDALHDRDDVRAVVLTANGKTFCAGADIKERAQLTGEAGDDGRLNRLVREVFYSVMECSKPVIAAVNGHALGAGFALTLCCDILLAADDAIFAMPEVDVGLAGGVKFLQRHFTPSKARRSGSRASGFPRASCTGWRARGMRGRPALMPAAAMAIARTLRRRVRWRSGMLARSTSSRT